MHEYYQLANTLMTWVGNTFQLFDTQPTNDEYFEIFKLQEKISQPFTWETNEAELRKLHRLFNIGIFERIGIGWCSVGFQQEDPISDIRGGGCLAITNMIYFISEYPHIALPMNTRRSAERSNGKNYPWAAVSISVTRMLAGIFHVIDIVVGRPIKREAIPAGSCYHLLIEADAFNRLYVLAFILLDYQFSLLHATYMEFPIVLQKTKEIFQQICINAVNIDSIEQSVSATTGCELKTAIQYCNQ
jgi:hypothetical protein